MFEIENHVLKKYIQEPNETEIIIPEDVTVIGHYAFGYAQIKKIVIPEGVTVIEKVAFYRCTQLEEIIIPESVNSIGGSAFMMCGLKKAVLPKNLSRIESGLFSECVNLTEIQIPEHVKSIGAVAFYGCQNLSEVILPESVTEIDNAAFKGCKKLKTVHIPESVTHIGTGAFSGTLWLKEQQQEHELIIINHILIKAKITCNEFIVPEEATSIAGEALYLQRTLEHLIIPEHVADISDDIFQGCTHIKSITYRGFTFSPDMTKKIKTYRLLAMVAKKDFSVIISLPVKYRVIWEMFSSKPDDTDVTNYIKKHFMKMIPLLIDNQDTDTMQKVLDSGKFVTKRNIDKLISHAIEHQRTEIQLMLMNYKNQHLGYEDSETIIQKKFSL